MRFIKSVVFVATLAYPFLVVMRSSYIPYLAVILAILWGIRAIVENRFYVIVALFFMLLVFFDDVKFLYPVIINCIFAFVFLQSLKNEAVITKFAKLQHKDLTQKAIIYTRNLTKLWGGFFIINAFISLLLGLIDEKWWLVYCGLISYILVGFFIGIEFIYRKLFVYDR